MGLIKFTTWIAEDNSYVYEVLGRDGKPFKGRIKAKNSDEAITALQQKGWFPTTVRQEIRAKKPEDNFDSDQDGIKNSSDSTPKGGVPDPVKAAKVGVPDPVKAAGIRKREARQRLGRSGFKIHGRSSAIGRTDPSKGVGVFKKYEHYFCRKDLDN